MSQVEKDVNLGSLVFADCLMLIEEGQVFINFTDNVPYLQFWHTNLNHYESLPVEVNTLKNLDCEELGERLKPKEGGVLYQDLHGVLPVKPEFQEVFDDVVLNGKLVFYQKGMVFVDNKIDAIVLPFENVEQMNVYQSDEEQWLEIYTKDTEKQKA